MTFTVTYTDNHSRIKETLFCLMFFYCIAKIACDNASCSVIIDSPLNLLYTHCLPENRTGPCIRSIEFEILCYPMERILVIL